MAQFPNTLPSLQRLSAGDAMDAPGREGDVIINHISDEIEALAHTVGVTGSSDGLSITKQVTDTQTAVSAHTGSTDNPHGTTAAQVGADVAGTAATAVETHAAAIGAHSISSVTGLEDALAGKSPSGHDHDAEYAPVSKGVTNGDAHNHAGGAGAAIAYANLSGAPTLGTAAALDVGTAPGQVVQLGGSAKLPAVDGSLLIGLPAQDHGGLAGLVDDDHLQYHTNARGDARYSAIDHDHTGAYDPAGSVATHAASTAAHGISAFGATLVDDSSASAARTTLGLGGAAILSVGTTAGTVAAGDDARLAAETAATIGSLISGATGKATPVDADAIGLSDSVSSNVLKKFSWANLKSALQSVFATLSGVAGGQTLIGGTGSAETLTLQSTSHGTKGKVVFGTVSAYDEVNARLGVGTTTPEAKIHVLSTGEQARLGYDTSQYAGFTVSSAGVLTISPTSGEVDIATSSATATLGEELVTDNPSFDSSLSGWTDSGSTWSWHASGAAEHTAGSASNLSQNVSVTSGSTYQVVVTISGRTAGSISCTLGAVSVTESGTATAFTASFSLTCIAGATGAVAFTITPTPDFDGRINAVSIKIVTLGSHPVSMRVLQSGVSAADLRVSTAARNLSLGVDTGRSITTGSNISNFGYYAGRSITTGSNTSNFGTNAGRYLADGVTSLTTPSNCTYIGASTKASADGVTNENVFGYNATGIGNNTVAIGDLNVTRTGLRGSVEILASSSTTASQIQGALSASWVDSTHATRKARLVISAYDTVAREGLRIEGDGTVARLGFYGVTAVVKPAALTATVGAAPAGGTGTAAGAWDTAGNRDLAIATINNLKTRVDQLESKLQALGLLT